MKKVTKGVVMIGCENKNQAEILREKVANDMGVKYIIQAPKKKKLKIKVFDVDKEDCERNQEFWRRIEEQNGFTKNTLQEIVHKSLIGKSQRMTIIAEVDAKTHDVMLEEGKVKIGWNICRVQDYIGILRCFKCCSYYHFARDYKKKVACGQCASKHASREYKDKAKKCEDKIKRSELII